MTEQEAKTIIRHEAYTNVRKHLEAIRKALETLGEDATMAEVYRWAEGSGDIVDSDSRDKDV